MSKMVTNWRRTSCSGLGWTAVAFAFAATGAALAQDMPTFYVIAPSLTDPFWITQQNGAKQAGEDFDVNVVFQAPAQDTGDAGMVPLVQGAIAAQPAGIAIDYTSKTMEGVTGAALDAGIPVVLYNNNRFEGENAPDDERITGLAFVGQDESVSGELLTKAWLPSLPDQPCKVLIVNPSVPDRVRADAPWRWRQACVGRRRLSPRGSRGHR
jgi:ABC-type sugar transport system substrate-binding protein